MSKITGNEPAMPGLTIRQYFAGVLMQGLISNSELLAGGSKNFKRAKEVAQSYAEDAVLAADALIAALNKHNPSQTT